MRLRDLIERGRCSRPRCLGNDVTKVHPQEAGPGAHVLPRGETGALHVCIMSLHLTWTRSNTG
jgi:hypothetical protein